MRHKYDFFSWFDDIIISGEVYLAKPDPGIFRLLLERIDRSAEMCLMIDDSKANIQTAHSLGFHTMLFQSPQQLQEQLNQLGILLN